MQHHLSTPTDLSSPLLGEKVQRLKETPLFDGSPTGHPLLEKQLIFLVLAGYKPVAEVASGHWVEIEGGRKTVADDPDTIGAFLESLGLSYSLSDLNGHATVALVALDRHLIELYRQAHNPSEAGRLFGYPETAVLAFEQGDEALLPLVEQEQIERDAGLPDGLTNFYLSREHSAEELAAVKTWYAALQAAGLGS